MRQVLLLSQLLDLHLHQTIKRLGPSPRPD